MKLLMHALVLLGLFGTSVDLFAAAHGFSNTVPVKEVVTKKELEAELIGAATTGEVGLIRELIAKGIDVNCFDTLGDTPLHKASKLGQVDCIKLLLGAGSDPNKPNKLSDTPFTEVLRHDNADLIQLFIDAGANIIKSGKKPEFLLTGSEDHHLMAVITSPKSMLIEALLTAGSSFEESYFAQGDDNVNFDLSGSPEMSLSKVRLTKDLIHGAIKGPLCLALQNNNGAAIYTLLKNNISITEIDSEELRQSCLSLMAIDADDRVVWSAINGESLSHAPTYEQIIAIDPIYEMSPILWACARGNLEVLRVFLANETVRSNILSILDQKNVDGQTAFTLAYKNGHEGVIKLLQDVLTPVCVAIGSPCIAMSAMPKALLALVMQYLINTKKD